jgi:lipopolysaccharide transport system permease protein
MLFYGITPGLQLVLVPLLLLGTVVTATGVGALLSALSVSYRDFQHAVPFMVQLWMFVTPVIYPPSIVPLQWRWLLFLNPMSGLIEGFRCAFLGGSLNGSHLAVSLVGGVAVFLGGAAYFQQVERRFADII